MRYQIECAGSFSSQDASDADIRRVFDSDSERGEFVILTAPNGSFIQAAGEGDGPYVLEYRDEISGDHKVAQADLTKTQVQDAFLSYLHGDDVWRSRWEWVPVKQKSGCFSAALVAFGVVCAASFAVHIVG